jgi:hypothetical protein
VSGDESVVLYDLSWGAGNGKRVGALRTSGLIDPSLQPKSDPEWARLAEGAFSGEVPVYFAAVPLILCVPFDLDYRPDLHPSGAQAIRMFVEMAKRQEFQNLIVYPRGKWFVISDNYIELFAALDGKPDFLPCFIMGKPENEMVQDIQGPIDLKDIRKVFGLA